MPKLLGVDPGNRWVGLATTDRTRTVATPLVTLDRSESDVGDRLKEIVDRHNIERIIIGFPDPLRTNQNERTREVEQFIETYIKPLMIPYETVSERYTTKRARRFRIHRGDDASRVPDSEAAALILQNYLDLNHENEASRDP